MEVVRETVKNAQVKNGIYRRYVRFETAPHVDVYVRRIWAGKGTTPTARAHVHLDIPVQASRRWETCRPQR